MEEWLNTSTRLAIKDYLKATGNGPNLDHPLYQTLGKHAPSKKEA